MFNIYLSVIISNITYNFFDGVLRRDVHVNVLYILEKKCCALNFVCRVNIRIIENLKIIKIFV